MNYHIIGMGTVGQALYNSVERTKLSDVICYDLISPRNPFNGETAISKSDAVFICVNTPTNLAGIQDASAITNILDILIDSEHIGLIIIKSTVLYKNIEQYINNLNIVMVPEFLEANTASRDFAYTLKLVLGGLSSRIAYDLHLDLFDFKEERPDPMYCTIKEAIDFKYTRNLLNAYNVLFWEGIQEISGNATKMAQMMKEIPVGMNSQISKDGYRGFGQSLEKDSTNYSACLDKDLSALLYSNPTPMLEYINNFNEGLM